MKSFNVPIDKKYNYFGYRSFRVQSFALVLAIKFVTTKKKYIEKRQKLQH